MKSLILSLVTITILLIVGSPALAASLGVSPSRVELEVPANGSTTIDLQAHFFTGDIQVSLVDIPLRVEPEVIHVDAESEPEDIQITIHGDESLASQVYTGYIRFLGMSGEMIAIAVQIKATVTHIVEGDPLPEITEEISAQDDEGNGSESVGQQNIDTATTDQESTDTSAKGQDNIIGNLSLNTVILIAAGVIFLGLVILAVSMTLRRRY